MHSILVRNDVPSEEELWHKSNVKIRQIHSNGLDKSAQRDEGNQMQMIESANPVLNDAGKWETETGQIHNGGVSKSARRDDDRNTTAMMLTNAGHKRNKWTMV